MGAAVQYCARCGERVVLRAEDAATGRELQGRVYCGTCSSSGLLPSVIEDPRVGSGRVPTVPSGEDSPESKTSSDDYHQHAERLKALKRRALRLRRRS